ncbi:hypothetical protein Y032_0026g1487 [Ancylostoma ceylanicum]|uniref:Uncharacterized protein n=1 Tax=Ancylostoma ceylanicum TaxID=53326 RepID=A0A016UVH4_9BILA|nr:hypothetical protein Y032_0026g1487 [Ancylostoma ceylanicum]
MVRQILGIVGYFVYFREGDYRGRTDGLEEIGPSALSFHGIGQNIDYWADAIILFLLPFRKLFNPPSCVLL